jgi:hypothetical protein
VLIPHPVTLHVIPSSAAVLISSTALMKLLFEGKGLLTCLGEIDTFSQSLLLQREK